MQDHKSIKKIIRDFSFTNEEMADYCGVSISMIKKIRNSKIETFGSLETQKKIVDFFDEKIKTYEKNLQNFLSQ